uniref:Uncharacterized protein n=1 Tax=Anopheles atroparvus TaxID=41427 RepID=A0AAG5DNY4_ANOAO
MLELRAALAAGMRRSARGKRRTSALTAASEDGDEGQAQSEPEEEDQDLFSSAPAKKPDSGESFEDGFTTPPRASDVAVPLSTASYQVLHTVAKEGKSPSSTDSSRTNSEDDDELTSQQVHEAAIEKLRPMDTTNPESGWVYTATGAGAATSATFGELQYLRATTSTNFSTAGASSPTHGYLYRNPVVADSTSPDPPTLGLSYRIHRASLRPHFDQIVFRWSKPHVTRSAVRRKLFKTEPKGDQDDAAGEPETPTARVSGLPAPPQRANDSLMFQSLRRSPPPSPRPVHYPNPPGTPIKRRRDITMPQRTPSAVVDSTTSPTSSSSLSSSSSSFSTTSTSSYASASHDYGRVRRKQLRSAELPSMPPTRAAATNADVSAASSNIPFLFGHTGASESGAMLIRLGNIPQPTIVRGEATRKAPAAAAATTPAAPVRKPLRF